MTSRWTPVGISGGGGTETPAISPHDPKLILLNCDMSGAYRTTNGGYTWQLLHWAQLTGCPFCAPVFHPVDPDVVFAAYSYAATLRISRDKGVTWTPYGEGLPGDLRQLAIDPRQPEHMLAGTTTASYYSLDGGEHWAPATGPAGQPLGFAFDQHACYAALVDGVIRSNDGGASWHPCAALPGGLAAFAGGADEETRLLYAWQLDGTILRSADGGETWETVALQPVRAGWENTTRWVLTTNVRPRTVYTVKPEYSAQDTVLRSDDAGDTWRPIAFTDKTQPSFNMEMNYITDYFYPRSLWGWANTEAAINPSDPEHLMFSHYCSMFITTDGGKSWRAGEVHPAPGKPGHWVGNGMVITTTWQHYLDPFRPEIRFICYTDLGLLRSDDAGASWELLRDYGPNAYEIAFDPEVPGRMWAAFSAVHDIPNNNIVTGGHNEQGWGVVGYSEDFGRSWYERNQNLPATEETWRLEGERYRDPDNHGTLPMRPVISVVLDPHSPRDARVLYASVWDHGVYVSTDGGKTWERRADGLGAPGVNLRVTRVRLHPDGTLFCAVTGKLVDGRLTRDGVGLYRSADQGRSWQEITAGLDIRWTTDFEIDPKDSRVLYLAVCDDPDGGRQEGGLYRTTDGGATWTRLARKSALHFSAILHPKRSGWLYMTLTYNETLCPPLWLSKDQGATWTAFDDYPFCSAHRVHFDPSDEQAIYVTSYGGSVWKGPVEP